jgi:hypothetical protein
MAKKSFLVPVAVSVAALAASPAAHSSTFAAPIVGAQIESAANSASSGLILAPSVRIDDSMRLAEHSSHVSHESHASHESHSSHSSSSY